MINDNVVLTTDWHLGHRNMCLDSYEGRPVGYEELIFSNLVTSLHPGDTLINLGDVGFGPNVFKLISDFLERLKAAVNVECVLVRGNHDGKSINFYRSCGFDDVVPSMVIDNFLLTHRPRAVEDHQVNIHGHLHSGRHRATERSIMSDANHVLLGIENTGYRPVRLNEVFANVVDDHGLRKIVFNN